VNLRRLELHILGVYVAPPEHMLATEIVYLIHQEELFLYADGYSVVCRCIPCNLGTHSTTVLLIVMAEGVIIRRIVVLGLGSYII